MALEYSDELKSFEAKVREMVWVQLAPATRDNSLRGNLLKQGEHIV